MRSIIQKEGKIRMRSWKSVALVTGYIGLLGLAVVMMLYSTVYSEHRLVNLGEQSKLIFLTLTVVQVLMISFIVPILTAGSISLEREKQTLDILLSTSLRPVQIIIGKLITSISQVLLLLVASLPIFSFLYLFGNVPIKLMVNLLVFYVIISVLFGAIGVFFSTLFKKTIPAIVLTYIFMFVLVVGTFGGVMFYVGITNKFDIMSNANFAPIVFYLNPGITFWTIIAESFGEFNVVNGFIKNIATFKYISCSVFVGLSGLLILLSSRILNPLKKRRK